MIPSRLFATALAAASLLSFASQAHAGRLSPGLERYIEGKAGSTEITVLVVMKDQADVPTLSRDLLADSLKPLGPLCALGAGDPVAIRQILRKIGVTAITVTPDGNGWRFEGQADFKGAVHPRTPEGPPKPPVLGDAPA